MRDRRTGKNKPYSTLEQRVAWFLANPGFLKGKPELRVIVRAMKKAGLIAPSTFWSDINLEEAMRQAKGGSCKQQAGAPLGVINE